MIHILCPDHNRPSGGIRVLYRTCDVLNHSGIPATLVHYERNFVVDWFEHSTCTTDIGQLKVESSDLLVIPEVFARAIGEFAPGVPRVVMNQNAYFTARQAIHAGVPDVYAAPDLLGIVCVSADNEAYLQYVFPSIDIQRLHVCVNPSFIDANNSNQLPRHISYMPRKDRDGAAELLWMLERRSALDGWSVEAIDGYSESKTIDAMRHSGVFLAFGNREGFGLPPAEAMASGCIVIGYSGFGGRELFHPEFSFPVGDGDIAAFARTVEQVANRWDEDRQHFLQMSRLASRHVSVACSSQQEAREIVAIFSAYARVASQNPKRPVDFNAELLHPTEAHTRDDD